LVCCLYQGGTCGLYINSHIIAVIIWIKKEIINHILAKYPCGIGTARHYILVSNIGREHLPAVRCPPIGIFPGHIH